MVRALLRLVFVLIVCSWLLACGGATTSTQTADSGHSLSTMGTGPLPRSSDRGVLVVGWRSEKHGPWLLRRLLVDGKITGLWEREGQIPGAVALSPGTHEVILEARKGNGGARTAPYIFSIKAGEVFLCPVDVEKQNPAPKLACGERTGDPVVTQSRPETSGGLRRPSDEEEYDSPAASRPRSEPRRSESREPERDSVQERESTPPPKTRRKPPPPPRKKAPPPPRKKAPPPPRKKEPPPPPPPPPPPDHGRAKLGKVKLMGGEGQMSTDSVLREFKRAKTEIMACYNQQIRAGNLAKGVILLDFMVWTDGCAAEIEPRVREKKLAPTAQCIKNIVRGFCVDEPRGGPVKLRVPLLFEPVPSQPRGRKR